MIFQSKKNLKKHLINEIQYPMHPAVSPNTVEKYLLWNLIDSEILINGFLFRIMI